MNIINDAQGTGWVTIKVKVNGRISSQTYRDNHLFLDWIICNIQDYNYQDVQLIKDEIELSDFDYVEDNDY